MRYLPQLLHRLFKPVFTTMDAHSEALHGDQISRDVDAAVSEHERIGLREATTFSARVDATIEDLLRKMNKPPGPLQESRDV